MQVQRPSQSQPGAKPGAKPTPRPTDCHVRRRQNCERLANNAYLKNLKDASRLRVECIKSDTGLQGTPKWTGVKQNSQNVILDIFKLFIFVKRQQLYFKLTNVGWVTNQTNFGACNALFILVVTLSNHKKVSPMRQGQ